MNKTKETTKKLLSSAHTSLCCLMSTVNFISFETFLVVYCASFFFQHFIMKMCKHRTKLEGSVQGATLHRPAPQFIGTAHSTLLVTQLPIHSSLCHHQSVLSLSHCAICPKGSSARLINPSPGAAQRVYFW